MHVGRYYPRGVPFHIFKMVAHTHVRMPEKKQNGGKKIFESQIFFMELDRSYLVEKKYIISLDLKWPLAKKFEVKVENQKKIIMRITPRQLNESDGFFLCGIRHHTKFVSKSIFVTAPQGAGEGNHGPKCSRTL